MSTVLDRQVRTTVPVWASDVTWLASPSRNGTNGGKCSSGGPALEPSPSTSETPERR